MRAAAGSHHPWRNTRNLLGTRQHSLLLGVKRTPTKASKNRNVYLVSRTTTFTVLGIRGATRFDGDPWSKCTTLKIVLATLLGGFRRPGIAPPCHPWKAGPPPIASSLVVHHSSRQHCSGSTAARHTILSFQRIKRSKASKVGDNKFLYAVRSWRDFNSSKSAFSPSSFSIWFFSSCFPSLCCCFSFSIACNFCNKKEKHVITRLSTTSNTLLNAFQTKRVETITASRIIVNALRNALDRVKRIIHQILL